MEFLRAEQWSPYVVGVGIGVLSWLTFLLSDHAIGCSTAFVRPGDGSAPGGQTTGEHPYYKRFAPAVTWDFLLVVGILIGSFISARLSGRFALELVRACGQIHSAAVHLCDGWPPWQGAC